MQEARFIADIFSHIGEEGDDVMLDLALDGVDPADIEAAALADGLADPLGDLPGRFHRFSRQRLDFKPYGKARLRRPDRSHLGPRISRYHALPPFPPVALPV